MRQISVCLLTLATLIVDASAQTATVIDAHRVGSNVEDIALVDKGRLNKHVAMLDGDQLRAVRLQGAAKPAELVCDLSAADVVTDWTPRGIAWVASSREFVVHDLWAPSHPTTELVFFDDRCQHVRRVEAVYPPGLQIGNTEGMDYIPHDSPVWPDHIAMIVDDETFRPLIVIFDLDGVVVDTIVPDEPVRSTYGLGLAYVEPGAFMVTLLEVAEAWTVDFDGSVSGPVPRPMLGETEGLDQERDGRFVAMDYQALLVRTDPALVPLAGSARDLSIPPNLPRPRAIDHQDGRFVFLGGLFSPELWATDDAFATGTHLVDLGGAPHGFATIPGTRTLAVTFPQARVVRLYDDLTATLGDPIDLSAAFPDAHAGAPAFVESTGQLMILERGPLGRLAVVQIVGFDGLPQGEVDFGATLGVAAVDSVSWRPSTEPLGELIVYGDGRIWVTDLAGTQIASYDLPTGLALQQIASINDGPDTGQLVGMQALDANRVYRLAID